jgi:predicted ATPase/DNA-binding SARP family transcriptional activator
VEFGVLGPLVVQAGGSDVEIRRGISRTLLAALLLRPGDTVSAPSLMEILWGEDQPRNPANALQIQISYLRKALSAGLVDARQPIVTRAGGYALEVDPTSVDAVRFEQLVGELEPPDDASTDDQLRSSLEKVDAALALWRGDAFSDVLGEPFVQGAVARLDEAHWQARELRVDIQLALGRHGEAVGELGTMITEQPLRERLHERLVVALYRSGRQADALRAYEAAREILLEELGLDPGPELRQLQSRILAQDPSLEWPSRARQPSTTDVAPVPEWRRSYVPAPTSPLVGREADLSRLRDLMARSRLVTLTGPGGAGKTRLAIDLARTVGSDPVWYVDLGPIELPEQVASTVASSLGATTGPADDPVQVVAAVLANESGLLVLDTCEHVLNGAAVLVATVLRQAPDMRVLATSRRPLAVGGEAAWPVPPLGLASQDDRSVEVVAASPAVSLFTQRAQAVRPDFELSEGNAADVAEICLALDGLPLAIELAAARVDVLGPAAILARLQNRFDILVEGPVDAAERQQTLRATVDWSVGLLSGEQRDFFARLAAFNGGFDLEAAEAVAGFDQPDSLVTLSGLVRHSMVVNEGGERFRLLDTLRAYAVELLAELDADDTRRRHAQHYALLAEACEPVIRGGDQRTALKRLRVETPNLRAAIDWSLANGDLEVAMRLAGSLAWFWTLDGRLDRATEQLHRAAAVEEVPAAVRAKVLWGYALMINGLGDIDRAVQAAQLSTVLARQTGDDAAIGAGLNALAVAHWSRGEVDAAIAAHDEAIKRFIAVEDVWGESICKVLRARTALDQGHPDGDRRLDEAVEAARRSGDAHVIGLALGLAAERAARAGDLPGAIQLGTESLHLQESIGYAEGTVSALHLLARFHFEVGDLGAARTDLLRSLQLAWKLQHAAATCEALEGLAVINAREGSLSEAVGLLRASVAERSRRDLPVRPGDRPAVDDLRRRLGNGPTSDPAPPLSEIVGGVLP